MSLRTLTPNDRTAPEAYIIASLVHGEWERALELIDELGPAPAYAPHLSTVAARLLDAGQTTAALRVARRAVELDPNCAAAQSTFCRRLLEVTDEATRGTVSGNVVEAALKQTEDVRMRVRQPGGADRAGQTDREDLEAFLGQHRRQSPQLHQSTDATRTPTVSLCLITRDEARNLPRVIESVRGLVTEIIVVDTGSTDDTLQVARRLKARVAQIAWEDDFAAARNYSLSLATGEWVLVLDADDEFTRECVPFLKQWLSREPAAEVVGLYRRYPSPGMLRDSVSIQPRLFRNRHGLRFKGAIHEELVGADGRAVQSDVTLTVTIYHHGAIDGLGAAAHRRERNSRILQRVLEREPDNLRYRFYLGLTHFEGERWSDAIRSLQMVVEQAEENLDFHPKAYACLGNALLNADRPLQAEEVIRAGLARFPLHPELLFCQGLISDHLGRLEEATAAHETALRGRFGSSLNWHDWACRESKPHLALCDLKLTLGDTEGATRHLEAAERFTGPVPAYAEIRDAIAQTEEERVRLADERQQAIAVAEARITAGDPSAGARMVEVLLAEGYIERACSLVETLIGSAGEEPWALIARGNVLLARELPGLAIGCFSRAKGFCPNRIEAWLGEAAALEAMGRFQEADATLQEAARQFPGRAEMNRALGMFQLEREQWDPAIRNLQRYLETRDHDLAAWLGLGKALLRSGSLPGAMNCYQRAASLSGGSAAVRIALGEAREFLARLTAATA